jgi:hypothetical protein
MSKDEPADGKNDRRDHALLVAWIGGGAVVLAAVITGLFTLVPHQSGSASTPKPSSVTSSRPSTHSPRLLKHATTQPSTSLAAVPTPLRQGILSLPNSNNADLTSSPPGWGVAESEPWPPGDVYYDAATSTLDMADAPATTAALGLNRAWNFKSCESATYGGNANAPVGSNIAPGHGLCFKDPFERRVVLLIVKARTSQAILLDVTVWPSP